MNLLTCIDVQHAWSTCNPATTARIGDAAQTCRANGVQVLWVMMQDWRSSFPPLPEPIAQSALKAFRRAHGDPEVMVAGDLIMGKDGGDMFRNRRVARALHSRGVTGLHMAGFMTVQCVDQSCESAMLHGFETRLLTDLTADRNDVIFWPYGHRRALRSGVDLATSAALWATHAGPAPKP